MKKLLPLLFLCSFVMPLVAQPKLPIPIDRKVYHEKIEAEQLKMDKMDMIADSILNIGDNEEINAHLSNSLYKEVNNLRYWIEDEPLLDKRNKMLYLTYTKNFLNYFREAWHAKQVVPIKFSSLFAQFSEVMQNVAKGDSLAHYVEPMDYFTANLFTRSMYDVRGSREAQIVLYRKYVEVYPEKIMSTIRPFVDEPFADTLISIAAKSAPSQIYSFAQSAGSPENRLIKRSKDPSVVAIEKMSRMQNALLYFPFIDDIVSGKKTVEQIEKHVGNDTKSYDSVGYYKMLVATAIDFHKRMSVAKDTPVNAFGTNGLYETLKTKAIQHFITPVNALHDVSNLNVRMRAIQPLSPEELYYMIVMGENDLYTSSYKHSYNRMIALLGPKPNTHQLLSNVDYDNFKKFIKMAANYAKLDDFLGYMPADTSAYVMKRFVSDLETGRTLEDAVDVADSYSSIANKGLQKSIIDYITENEVKSAALDNARGQLIYSLLKTIFLSTDTSSGIDLTKELGIPNINEIGKKQLEDDKGRVVQQVFFYGDEDGKIFFPQFVNSFSSANWTITPKKEWVEFKSKKGEEYVFANRPLDSDQNLDDSAQVHLNNYLRSQGMQPSIVVHRGHSYWLGGTLKRMPFDTKIVVLGSCGGYQNLADILKGSPDAHIISSKEIGSGNINQPIMNYINETIQSNSNLNWRAMWQKLGARFTKDPSINVREGWENYVPPYRNLGAIFIKAYNRKTQDSTLL